LVEAKKPRAKLGAVGWCGLVQKKTLLFKRVTTPKFGSGGVDKQD